MHHLWAVHPPDATASIGREMSALTVVLTIAMLVAVAALMVALHSLRRVRGREHELGQLLQEQGSQLQIVTDALAKAATKDSVTGLANHRQFQDFLRSEWRRALRDASPLSVIMIDMDHFSDYNDKFGHEAGDACLRQVGEAFARSIQRPGDLVARYGGEEFGIVLGRTDSDGALRIATKLQVAVSSLALPNPNAPDGGGLLTVSVGAATATPAIDSNWEELALVASADRALQEAKEAGRNRIVTARG